MKTMHLKMLASCLMASFCLLSSAFCQIEAGNSVQISILGVPGEEKSKIDAIYPVSESGTVNLPFIGNVRAAGLRPEVLAASIQNAYKSAQIYNDPTIHVISTTEGTGVRAQVIHAGGQVRKTGPIPFQKNLTLYQAVQAAGGATEFGSLKRVKLYREGKMQIVDLTNPQFMRIPMQPDDTIEVPQKNWIGQ